MTTELAPVTSEAFAALGAEGRRALAATRHAVVDEERTSRGRDPRREDMRRHAARGNALSTERAAERNAALVEDVEFMLDTGESPEWILHRLRLGISLRSLERRLHRLGRPDLAAKIAPNVARCVCQECGGPASDSRSEKCIDCRRASRFKSLQPPRFRMTREAS